MVRHAHKRIRSVAAAAVDGDADVCPLTDRHLSLSCFVLPILFHSIGFSLASDFRAWSRCLTRDEVKAGYRDSLWSVPDLHWPFNEQSGFTIQDATGQLMTGRSSMTIGARGGHTITSRVVFASHPMRSVGLLVCLLLL
jgi:hypothetical protein